MQGTQPPPDAAPPGSLQDSPQNSTPSPATEPSQSGAERKSEPTAAPPAPEAAPEPQKTQPEAATKKPESKAPAPKTAKKKHRHRKTTGATSATPDKKVVRNGGTVDPAVQLTPGMSPEQASSQRQSTTELLAATDANLKQISSRSLDSSQQDSISQIRKYMEQAKTAEKAGDLQRAHNLASKAVLLSDDLVKH